LNIHNFYFRGLINFHFGGISKKPRRKLRKEKAKVGEND